MSDFMKDLFMCIGISITIYAVVILIGYGVASLGRWWRERSRTRVKTIIREEKEDMFISRKQFEREMAKVRDEVYEHMSREQQYSRMQEQIWKLEERVSALEYENKKPEVNKVPRPLTPTCL